MNPSPTPPEWDLLLSAAQKNNADRIRDMVNKQGVSPNHSNAVGQTALHIAALWANVEAVQALVDVGASCHVHNRLTGATPLHMVAQSHKGTLSRRFKTAEILLQATADSSKADNYGKLPVDWLATPTNEEEVELYTQLHEKLQPNPPGIFDAIVDYDLGYVKDLIQREDVSTIHFRGKTPLSLAVQKLLELMSEPNDSINSQRTLLDIIQSLISAGASTAAPASDEDTPLRHLLTQLQTFYEQQQSSSDRTGDETLRQSTRLLEEVILIFNGNSFPADLLQQAARRDQALFLRFLVERQQLDPNRKGRQGMTALQFAARSGKLNALRYLLSLPNINVEVTDDRGQSPLDAARVNNKDEAVRLLEEFIAKHETN